MNKRRLVSCWVAVLAGMLLISPVYAEITIKNTNNFVILFDTSGSMGQKYRDTGKTKALIAKDILREMNRGIRGGYKAALYTFTPFEEYYPMQEYREGAFGNAIEKLPEKFFAGGLFGHPTPLGKGIKKLSSVLSGVTGRTAVYIFSDGRNTDDLDPAEEARNLHERYDVCFYIVSMAETKEDKMLLDKIQAVNECSIIVDFEYARTNPDVSLIPIGRNAIIQFEVNKADGGFEFQHKLKELGKYLKANPDTKIQIAGHTCNIGADKYNMELSKRRAENTKAYLIKAFGISSKRMVVKWHGKSAPVASNDTEEGRIKNRRVEVKIIEE